MSLLSSSERSTANEKSDASAAQRVLRQLRDDIISGKLRPGARIVERKLSHELSVSRTPLREALKLLESEGLIELSQNRGARVREFTERQAIDLFEVLSVVEGRAAEIAANRISPQMNQDLLRDHYAMARCFEAGDTDGYFDLNTKIHRTIVRAADNEVLTNTHANLQMRANQGRFLAVLDVRRWSEGMEEHEELIAAISRKDSTAAGEVWRRHLSKTGYWLANAVRLNRGMSSLL
ncbi:MAG: GntR family transcriptional regulator [Pseudomonadota bacterium]